jgi:hypothetical protein
MDSDCNKQLQSNSKAENEEHGLGTVSVNGNATKQVSKDTTGRGSNPHK